MKFHERKDFYEYGKDHLRERTKSRLIQIEEAGMTEFSNHSFGVWGVMSGLYIEMVWGYSDKSFKEYMDWAISIIEKHKK